MCVCLHLKVPGWLSDLNALLTRNLPNFFLRFNEIRGGRGNMGFVSGSLRRILKFFTMTFLGINFKLLKTDSNDSSTTLETFYSKKARKRHLMLFSAFRKSLRSILSIHLLW